MNRTQFRSFLRNRIILLKAAKRILSPISFNPEKLARRLRSIDHFVLKSADAIATSDRSGAVFTGSLALGLGLSDRLVAKIKNRHLQALIPKSGGFYYVLALGFGTYVTKKSAGKSRLTFELIADVDRLEKIHTYAGEVSVAINWGVVVDRVHTLPLDSGAPVTPIDKLDSHYIGILGVVRQSATHFSYSLITGLALPPYLPVGMVYTNRTTRLRVPLITMPWFTGRKSSLS